VIEANIKVNEQRKKIHPHKFTLWVALGSIVMMFAGLTSAYIVKRDAPGWTTFSIPRAFWYSTGVILLSSLTVQMALKAFKERTRTNDAGNMTAVARTLSDQDIENLGHYLAGLR